jgi:hypothetical protein
MVDPRSFWRQITTPFQNPRVPMNYEQRSWSISNALFPKYRLVPTKPLKSHIAPGRNGLNGFA